MCVYAYMCLCVCVYTHTHTHTHIVGCDLAAADLELEVLQE
jgi:hypothetical protein